MLRTLEDEWFVRMEWPSWTRVAKAFREGSLRSGGRSTLQVNVVELAVTGITRSERVIMGREFLSEFLVCGTGIPSVH